MIRNLLGVILAVTAFAGQAHARKACEGIFPKNNFWIGPNVRTNGISKADFDALLDKITTIYQPVAQAQGYTLVYEHLWTDGTVNSDTDVQGSKWVVNS